MLSALRRPCARRHVPHSAAIEMPSDARKSSPIARLLVSAALLAVIAAAAAGCQTTQSTETTGSLPVAPIAAADRSDADWRRDVQVYGEKYRADPTKLDVAMPYAQALRATGQRAQAVAVLERASIENPHDKAVLGAYGRALAEAGKSRSGSRSPRARAFARPARLAHPVRARRRARSNGPARRCATTLFDGIEDRSGRALRALESRPLLCALQRSAQRRGDFTSRRSATAGRYAGTDKTWLSWSVLQGSLQGSRDNRPRRSCRLNEAAANVAYLRQMLDRRKDLRDQSRNPRPIDGPG